MDKAFDPQRADAAPGAQQPPAVEPAEWIAQGREQRRGQFHFSPDFAEVPLHAEAAEGLYQRIIGIGKLVLRAQDIQVFVDGEQHIPQQGGALLAMNHTGYYDFILGAIPAYLRGKRLVRFMAKKEIFDVGGIGKLMRVLRHIPVDRSRGAESIGVAVESLRRGSLVAIFPEATISRSFELKDFKTGAARIAAEAGVPLIPMAAWGSQRIWTKGGKKNLGRHSYPVIIKVGAPVDTTGSAEEITARLKAAVEALLADARHQYTARFGPFAGGESWLPASLGGSAPTLEEANAMDEQSRADKAAKREAKAQARAAKENRKLAKRARKQLNALARWGRKES